MPNRPPPVLSQRRLIACALINQLATPGLGSWLAQRRWVGAGQMTLSFTGFLLICAWMLRFFYAVRVWQMDGSTPGPSPDWLRVWGFSLFGAGWLWALMTSIALLRQSARTSQPPAGIPPKLPSA